MSMKGKGGRGFPNGGSNVNAGRQPGASNVNAVTAGGGGSGTQMGGPGLPITTRKTETIINGTQRGGSVEPNERLKFRITHYTFRVTASFVFLFSAQLYCGGRETSLRYIQFALQLCATVLVTVGVSVCVTARVSSCVRERVKVSVAVSFAVRIAVTVCATVCGTHRVTARAYNLHFCARRSLRFSSR